MATFFQEDFEGGSHGATATTGNTNFGILPAGTTFSNLHPAEGSLGVRCTTTTAATRTMQIDTGVGQFNGPRSVVFVAFYVYLESLPANLFYVASLTGGGSQRNNITAVHTSSYALLTDTLYRIEWQVNNTSSFQQFKIFLGHDTTPVYDSGSATYNQGTMEAMSFGITASAANVDVFLDWLTLDNASWVGPAVANVAPTADAGADQVDIEPYTIVTLTGSDSDTDGTIASRQWTQTGGSPTVTIIDDDQATATFKAPGSLAGTTLTFEYEVTDNDGATDSDTCTVTVYPSTERAAIGGVMVPLEKRTAW
jgi:hypothetical protein